jgi:hypothetical protein
MYMKMDKTKESKSRASALSVAQKQGSQKQALAFVDNRQTTSVQKKFQEINNWCQQIETSQLMAHANGCSCVSCTGASMQHSGLQAVQAKSMGNNLMVYQLAKCPLCSQLPDYDDHSDRNCPLMRDESSEVEEVAKEIKSEKIPGWKKKGGKGVKMGKGERELRKRDGHGMMTKDQAKRYVPDY